MKPKFLKDNKPYVSGRIRRFASLYARMLLKGNINYQTLMNVYDRYEKKPEWKVKNLLKRKAVQNMINEEINKLYDSKGISPDFVIQKQLEVLNKAIEKEDLTNANKVLESFKESLGMNPSKIKRYESFGLRLKGSNNQSNLYENYPRAIEESNRTQLPPKNNEDSSEDT